LHRLDLFDDTSSEFVIERWRFEEVEATKKILVSIQLAPASAAVFDVLQQPLVGLEG
jgi:hypothetical protein